ncbi:MAG TPA: hypothetical protein VG410_04985 [Solirubrobacteraceae bacterium]|nr:hypothetical protein [Solirubrobacteraceae bacterium]
MTFSNVVALIALAVALGGGAYAAVGGGFISGSGTIQGCVNRGTLDVVAAGKKCPRGTVSLPFNERGTPGSGPAWYSYAPGGAGGVDFTNTSGGQPTPKTLASRFLPAGSYSVTAKVNLVASATTATTGLAVCSLVSLPSHGSPTEDTAAWTPTTSFSVSGAVYAFNSVPLGLDIKTAQPVTVSIQCLDYSGASASSNFRIAASDAELSAVHVTGLS